jgi:predicted nucleic acid-binding protein
LTILVDTSIWVDHLRGRETRLARVLEDELVLMHPFVIGELACGNLRNRVELLSLWSRMPSAPTASDAETLRFIEQHELMGIGLGYIDVHLLASTALAGDARLWTTDRRLAIVAARLRLAHQASR